MELLFPLLLVALLVPMFLGVRRQKREAEKVATMRDSLKIGDTVTTTSGLFGTVVDIDDATVDLEIAEDVVTTWRRDAILEVRTEEAATTEEAAEPAAATAVDAEPVAALAEPAVTAAERDAEAAQAPAKETAAETRLTKD
ncbi:preprotein translocase subunit YajC [Nocardia panacis]|uniref:Preprotein translocase subunit YajC n=1 Tax=Nocardia panacis TaxID=2340916 RepID=A0A3A4K662_9NOCA|nr:preprotein translocase subunit YajC [Nocardia panacis]RJO68400.1 preprotein translocase subunit YajC [Nocardia panacis]